MLIKFILMIFFTLFSLSAIAENYFTFMYKIEEGESFSIILKKFVKDTAIINAKTPLVKKIIANNPQVKQWDSLPSQTVIELFISDDMMDFDKYKVYEAGILKKVAEIDEASKKTNRPEGFKGSIFYMASSGTFNQKANDIAEVTHKQISPVSIGSSFNYYPKNKYYSLAFSVYYSYLVSASNSLTADKITIPPEIGGTLYGEYYFQQYNFTAYSGPDYESFSTFNLKALQNVKKVYVDDVAAAYFTLGVSKSITLFDKKFFTKFSISKSIATSYSSNAPLSAIDASDLNQKYSGYRYLFYLNYKLNDKFYVHTLLKYHTMTGPSDLSTFRIGLGFGYLLF